MHKAQHQQDEPPASVDALEGFDHMEGDSGFSWHYHTLEDNDYGHSNWQNSISGVREWSIDDLA